MARLSKKRKELLTRLMKETIFEAASSVLCEHGVTGITMNRVAAAANVAKSSLYDYFDSKEELLRFVYERIVVPISLAVGEVVASKGTATEKLWQALCAIFEQIGQHRKLVGLMLQAGDFAEVVESSKETARANALRHFTAIFAQGVYNGEFHDLEPVQTARMFLACVDEIFRVQEGTEPFLHVTEHIDRLLAIFLHGISTGRDAQRHDAVKEVL